mmetsp:Transcript_11949/g.17126  ORF Transcript_11949/g.17126 Transcript_11949/m.17126 type:complete len:158 (+) Transcript_11949:918-1391(+)
MEGCKFSHGDDDEEVREEIHAYEEEIRDVVHSQEMDGCEVVHGHEEREGRRLFHCDCDVAYEEEDREVVMHEMNLEDDIYGDDYHGNLGSFEDHDGHGHVDHEDRTGQKDHPSWCVVSGVDDDDDDDHDEQHCWDGDDTSVEHFCFDVSCGALWKRP